MSKKLRKVHVRWLDSAATSTPWMDDDTTLSLDECESVGYLVERTKTTVLIAQSRSSGQWGNPLAIPRVAVTSMRTLE